MSDQLKLYVERWREAGVALAQVKERELREVDTREAVRQLFSDSRLVLEAPVKTTSGLVEQQAWFARLRHRACEE